MRVCVYGCGAIGSLLAARLVGSGMQVSAVARGAHLDAIKSAGLTLLPPDNSEPLRVEVAASDTPAELGEQDVVFLTMKSHSVAAIADQIGPLLGPDTAVVTACNGMPWWYFHALPQNLGAPELVSVDPGKKLWNAIDPRRAIGSVVYPAAVVESPGVVRHVFGDRFTLGEPDGSASVRLAAIAEMLRDAGFDAPTQADIRAEIWTKLVANAAFNPVSVITGKSLGEMIDDPATYSLLESIMDEVVAVAQALGVVLPMTPAQLLEATRQLGKHKTSMLQDLEAGRPLELQPIVGAVLELAELRSVVTVVNLSTVYQLVSAKVGKLR